MPQITFGRFDMGLDLRKGANVSDANRLLELTNAYVTTGLAVQRRPGLTAVGELPAGTGGLFTALGHLNVVAGASGIPSTHEMVHVLHAPHGGRTPVRVTASDIFMGQIVAAVQYGDGSIRHHLFSGGASSILPDPCPHGASFLKHGGKLFAPAEDTVRYCATGNARDWTASGDAGFLPTGMHATTGDTHIHALSLWGNRMACFARDSIQIWDIDPDPNRMGLYDRIEHVGSHEPGSVRPVGNDLFFLSDAGFRSIATLQYTDHITDVDVGGPIDAMVRPLLRGLPPQESRGWRVVATHYSGTGQYLCALGRRLFVYSRSRAANLAAWSVYDLPQSVQPVQAFAQMGSDLYLRCGNRLLRLDPDSAYDDGTPIETVVQVPWMDCKTPGHLKVLHGIDVVMQGSARISVGFDARDPEAFTHEVEVSGNTRGGGLIPLPCSGTEFSVRIRSDDGHPFRLDAVTLYYDVLGVL